MGSFGSTSSADPFDQLYAAMQACGRERFAGDLGVSGILFNRRQLTPWWERAGEPDAAVAAQRADLQDRFGLNREAAGRTTACLLRAKTLIAGSSRRRGGRGIF